MVNYSVADGELQCEECSDWGVQWNAGEGEKGLHANKEREKNEYVDTQDFLYMMKFFVGNL